VTPYRFRRTYITLMVAAEFDLAHIQAQVGHRDPTMTLGVYALLMQCSDRNQLRAEIREFLGISGPPQDRTPLEPAPTQGVRLTSIQGPQAIEKVGNGRAAGL
jgi:hypothetical protein